MNIMKTAKTILSLVLVLFTSSLFAQVANVKVEKSVIKWEGKKIGGAHDGNIKLKEGQLKIEGNKIVSGTFVMDMNSITNSDIESEDYKNKLIGHLKSDDFFGVANFPTSKLVVKESTAFKDGKATVKGDLTIKEKTHPIEFVVTKDGNTYSTVLTVDRAKYDVRYGSKSFFDDLGDKVIYDEFTLDVKLVVE